MTVNPDDVRLQPNNETPYAWQVDDPDLKPFFGKSLSKHSIGAYMELCSAVGQSFRAVHRDEAVKATKDKLQILEEEKILLERALGAAKEQSQTLRDEKMDVEKQLQEAEEKAAMQIVEMEQKIKTLEQSVGDLQSQAKECWCITEGYERTFAQYSAGLNEAILLLQSLSASTMFPTGGGSLPFEKMDHGQIAPVACVPSQNIEY
ncbi:hypothetical protein ASPCAL06962 [Aspergillus calidoustus]|uniref:Uncharacterized protein n=1 Tax=Aspergillus calidoustus TaxID=454130 RepID=A0A0U5C9P0_ASPCI|nr:hypothetical protein ASPCAL06962 [Aspergillus calidoustus]